MESLDMNSSKFLINNLPVLKKFPIYLSRRTKLSKQSKIYHNVTHCIFDLDGAILDNQESIDMANKDIFEMYKLCYTPEWRYKLMGRSCQSMWEKVINNLKIRGCTWQKLDLEHSQLFANYLMGAPLKPGIETLLEHLKSCNIPMAAVTSSCESIMEKKTAHIKDLMKMFSFVVCGDHEKLKQSKPNGEIFNICKGSFIDNPPPESCLVFESTPNGILAAIDASMQVIGVSSILTPFTMLRQADQVLNHFDEFNPVNYGMSSFPGQIIN